MTFILLLATAAGTWFWFDTMQAREAAVEAAGRYCAREDVQLLDETVALQRLGFSRRNGRMRILRTYRFEYTTTGASREAGGLVMVGHEVVHLTLGSPRLPH